MHPLALIFSRARTLPMLGAAALMLVCSPVWAEDTPFDLEQSSWMSFDRYNDKPYNWLAPDQRAAVAAQPVVVAPPTLPASMPILAEPTRPIITPVMPGLNKNFDLKVDSTEDDHRLPIITPTKPDAKADTNLPDTEWKNAVEAARNIKTQTNPDDKNSGTFNVRYSALPPWIKEPPKKAPAMTPVPATTLAAVKIAQPFAPPPPAAAPPAPAVSPVDVAACAALDAYKKRQLQAIESDRQTLAALQNAISQLGLQKQLDFMPGVAGSLNAQAAPDVTVPR